MERNQRMEIIGYKTGKKAGGKLLVVMD